MRDIRRSIAMITTVLLCLGIVMIFSSSGVYALKELGSSTYYLYRHLLFLTVGLILMFLVMAVDYREIRNYVKPLILVAMFLLILVLIPGIGKEIYGARRWFRIGPLSFQPSEFMKVVMILYVADFLARKQEKIKDFWQGVFPVLAVLGMACLLIHEQPDLGTTVFISGVVVLMLFIAGARFRYLGFLGLLALPAMYFLIIKVPYRMARIMAFLDPWQDSRGIGFQLTQSQIALGSGGFFGIGLGKSIQKLFYLPAAHTDFIFSIIGEELGLLGTASVIILFALFIWQGCRIVKRTNDHFGYFLGVGIVIMIGLQAAINIGVSIGALPTKGLPLPFVSYGGSALIFDMVAVGLLLNVSRTEEL